MHIEALIGNAANLFDTRYSLSGFEVYPTGRAIKATKVVLVKYFGWKEFDINIHILKTLHGSIVSEVLDVKVKEACIRRGQDAADNDL